MRVKSCVASDGAGHVINLSDEYGCVLRPKMISRFLKARAPDEKATVITYAFFHAFKFPDALSVHIKCKVEICRHGCLDHCQASGSNERHDIVEQELIEPSAIERESNHLGPDRSNAVHENNEADSDIDDEEDEDSEPSFYDTIAEVVGLKSKSNKNEVINSEKQQQQHQNGPIMERPEPVIQHKQQQLQLQREQQIHQQKIQQQQQIREQQMQQEKIQQEQIHQKQIQQQAMQAQALQAQQQAHQQAQQMQQQSQQSQTPQFIQGDQDQPQAQAQTNDMPLNPQSQKEVPEVHEVHEDLIDDILPKDVPMHEMLRQAYLEAKKAQDEKFPHGPRAFGKDRMGLPPMAGPRSLNLGEEIRPFFRTFTAANRTYRARHRRSIVVSDRQARSADIGVTGVFDVISEADLQFSPRDGKQETETVFQGKITEEVVYGICLPVPGFSILFILVTSATVVSALIAGSLLYRYQLQKAAFEAQNSNMNPNTFASWMTLRLFRMNNMHACDAATGNPAMSTPQ